MITVDSVIDDIIRRETMNFTNDPDDPGGPTKGGVTIDALTEYLGRKADINDIRNLKESTVRDLYRKLYVMKPGFGMLGDPSLMGLVVDSGVLHGRNRTTKWLQYVVGAKQDGVLGPMTLRAVQNLPPAEVYRRFLKRRFKGVADVVQDNPRLIKYLEGWINRAAEFVV